MLSQENISKLNFNGLYKCEPMIDKLPSYKRNTPYWCVNWTFKPHIYTDTHGEKSFYMRDTYWGSCSDSLTIELTDKNFDKFELIFDFRDVESYTFSSDKFYDYPDDERWVLSVDSGGMYSPKRFIKKGSMPIKERVVERLQESIDDLEYTLKCKKKDLERVKNDEIDLRWV